MIQQIVKLFDTYYLVPVAGMQRLLSASIGEQCRLWNVKALRIYTTSCTLLDS